MNQDFEDWAEEFEALYDDQDEHHNEKDIILDYDEE